MVNALFVISELDGLVKTGGLADVARHLPIELNKQGTNTIVALPHYQVIDKTLDTNIKTSVIKSYSLPLLSDAVNPQFQHESSVTVRKLKLNELAIYTFEVDDLFARDGLYDSEYQAFADNGVRFGLFSYAVVRFFASFGKELNFEPNIIHCNDWHTGLVPLFTKQFLPLSRTLLTIHNGAFHGEFSKDSLRPLMPLINQAQQILAHVNADQTQHNKVQSDSVHFLQYAIEYTDKIVAVSPNYATELLTPLGSHDLHATLIAYQAKLTGILNGCDYTDWNPESDEHINHPYSAINISNKMKNKLALQAWAGLPQDENIPLFVQVSRLTNQKGMEYLVPSLVDTLEHPIQIIIIGTGDPKYTEQLQELMLHHPTKLFFFNGFTEQINHQAMAGADFFLIPSLFEPCGLTQMHALAMGTLPIARKVGGLVDTVIDINDTNGNGILFEQPEVASLSSAIRRGVLIYLTNPDKFNIAIQNAMRIKFYWQRTANSYHSLYKQLLSI